MVSGHLSIKKGFYYCVLSYKDEFGKRKSKWISTRLPEKGNKKRAEEQLIEERRKFIPPVSIQDENMLFSDFMTNVWLPSVKSNIEVTTYASYQGMLESRIAPYFKEQGIILTKLKPKDIQDFYTMQSERVKPATVKHYHAIIHEALEQAVNMEMILFNPSDRVTIPKNLQYIPEYYTTDELNRLFECIKGDEMELLFKMVCFYGMRKSEALGLKWSAVNFEDGTFVIRHVVTKARVDGKNMLIKKDRPKRKASYRTMPLVDMFRDDLLTLREQHARNRELCGSSYCIDDQEYIFVDSMGYLFDPGRVSRHFKAVLRKNGLKEIRFHDTRHSAGSALCQSGVNMKEIQEWLGHSDFSTTANIYSHLRSDTKRSTAKSMLESLGMATDDAPNKGIKATIKEETTSKDAVASTP